LSAPPSVPGSVPLGQPVADSQDEMIQSALDTAPSDSEWSVAAAPLAGPAKATTPQTLLNFIATGYPEKGLPCFGCVKKVHTKADVGLPGPFNYVYHGDRSLYIVSFTDVSFKGNCKLAVAVTSKKTVIDKFGTTAKNNKPNYYYLYWNTRSFPSYSGLATMTASLSCPHNGTQKTSAPIFFE
jgi:hypothetical protein